MSLCGRSNDCVAEDEKEADYCADAFNMSNILNSAKVKAIINNITSYIPISWKESIKKVKLSISRHKTKKGGNQVDKVQKNSCSKWPRREIELVSEDSDDDNNDCLSQDLDGMLEGNGEEEVEQQSTVVPVTSLEEQNTPESTQHETDEECDKKDKVKKKKKNKQQKVENPEDQIFAATLSVLMSLLPKPSEEDDDDDDDEVVASTQGGKKGTQKGDDEKEDSGIGEAKKSC